MSNEKQMRVKQTISQPNDAQEDLLNDVLKLLDKLWQMRLVEKISRPIGKGNKEAYCRDFAQKVETMNEKLRRFQINIVERTLNEDNGR